MRASGSLPVAVAAINLDARVRFLRVVLPGKRISANPASAKRKARSQLALQFRFLTAPFLCCASIVYEIICPTVWKCHYVKNVF